MQSLSRRKKCGAAHLVHRIEVTTQNCDMQWRARMAILPLYGRAGRDEVGYSRDVPALGCIVHLLGRASNRGRGPHPPVERGGLSIFI